MNTNTNALQQAETVKIDQVDTDEEISLQNTTLATGADLDEDVTHALLDVGAGSETVNVQMSADETVSELETVNRNNETPATDKEKAVSPNTPDLQHVAPNAQPTEVQLAALNKPPVNIHTVTPHIITLVDLSRSYVAEAQPLLSAIASDSGNVYDCWNTMAKASEIHGTPVVGAGREALNRAIKAALAFSERNLSFIGGDVTATLAELVQNIAGGITSEFSSIRPEGVANAVSPVRVMPHLALDDSTESGVGGVLNHTLYLFVVIEIPKLVFSRTSGQVANALVQTENMVRTACSNNGLECSFGIINRSEDMLPYIPNSIGNVALELSSHRPARYLSVSALSDELNSVLVTGVPVSSWLPSDLEELKNLYGIGDMLSVFTDENVYADEPTDMPEEPVEESDDELAESESDDELGDEAELEDDLEDDESSNDDELEDDEEAPDDDELEEDDEDELEEDDEDESGEEAEDEEQLLTSVGVYVGSLELYRQLHEQGDASASVDYKKYRSEFAQLVADNAEFLRAGQPAEVSVLFKKIAASNDPATLGGNLCKLIRSVGEEAFLSKLDTAHDSGAALAGYASMMSDEDE